MASNASHITGTPWRWGLSSVVAVFIVLIALISLPCGPSSFVLGIECPDGNECGQNQICDTNSDTCVCDDGYRNDTQPPDSCRMPTSGENCTQAVGCSGTYYCDNTCKAREGYGGTCNANTPGMCQDQFECRQSQCLCPSHQYYNNQNCNARVGYEGTCNANTPGMCHDQFECRQSQCLCPSNQYYDNQNCNARLGYGGTCTTNTGMCQDQFECRQTFFGSQCLCPSNQYYDSQNCNAKKAHGEQCSTNIDDECDPSYQCRESSSSDNLCLCEADHFYDNSQCKAKTVLEVTSVNRYSFTTDSIVLRWIVPDLENIVTVLYKIGPNPFQLATTTTGVSVSTLTAGRKYSFTIRSSVNPLNYGSVYYDVSYEAWTKPDVPNVSSLQGSTLSSSTSAGDLFRYDVSWASSSGDVDRYTIVTSANPSSPIATPISSASIDLRAGTTYNFTITAYNGNDDTSDAATETFNTKEEAPGQVKDPTASSETNDSISVAWKTPEYPNGQITAYTVQIWTQDSCLFLYTLSCNACPSPTVNSCDRSFNDSLQSQESLNSQDSDFNYVIPGGLDPFTTYTVDIFAWNGAGQGAQFTTDVTTKSTAANSVKSVTVENITDISVGLRVTWEPGQISGTGNKFNVILFEESDLSGTDLLEIRTVEVNYGEDLNQEFMNLLAYWKYQVSVIAINDDGQSSPVTQDARTAERAPGLVTSFVVKQDAVNAQLVSVSFGCPAEKERNGILNKYVVKKTLISTQGTAETKDVSHNSACTFTVDFTNGFDVGSVYRFQVQAVTTSFDGEFNDGATITINPRGAKLDRQVSDYVDPGASDGEQERGEVTLNLCSPCLLDGGQGVISTVGIAVCAKTGADICPSVDAVDLSTPELVKNLPTWAQASTSDTPIFYRCTEDDFHLSLAGGTSRRKLLSTDFTYVVGDSSCSTTDTMNYCNGRLPDGADVTIVLAACTNQGCDHVVITRTTRESSSDSSNVGAIVSAVIGVLVAVAVVVVVVFFIWRRRTGPERARPTTKDAERPRAAETERQRPTDTERRCAAEIKTKRPVYVRTIAKTLIRYHKNANLLFQGDFEDIIKLSSQMGFTTHEAERESNRTKNRYVNILPYDHSRVKLEENKEDGTSDFVNANYIAGYNSSREYIATQDPLISTIPDFWSMLWEQGCRIVVMLTDLIEPKYCLYWPENLNEPMSNEDTSKCYQYWPENQNEPILYGDVMVKMTECSQLNKFFIRKFTVSKANLTRCVTHFFLPQWADFKANLKADDVIDFVKYVRQEATSAYTGPIIVHCSAGVGRTGTFIALDYFMQYVEEKGLDSHMDIFNFVLSMRKNRPSMVQEVAQYIFIFEALNEVIQKKIKAEEERLYERPEFDYVNTKEAEPYYAGFPATTFL